MFTLRKILLVAAALFHATQSIPTPNLSGRSPGSPASYIIVFKPETPEETVNEFRGVALKLQLGISLGHEDGQTESDLRSFIIGDCKGYAGTFDESGIRTIESDPNVDWVELDQMYTISALTTQNNSPWGLARISSRTESKSRAYTYDASAGGQTWVYVLDTGIQVTHPEFGGRAILGPNLVVGKEHVDAHGHGTHIAATIGGTTYGVAKKTNLISVKVFSGQESPSSTIIDGIQWAVQDIRKNLRVGRSVINMSLGGPYSAAINKAASAAVDAGIVVVVAAGNENKNAENTSPASAAGVITVGATTAADTRWEKSNYGKLVNIWAPGHEIVSAWKGNQMASASGSSMACAHVSGLAVYLMTATGVTGPPAVSQKIILLSTKGILKGIQAGSPNVLAYNGIAA